MLTTRLKVRIGDVCVCVCVCVSEGVTDYIVVEFSEAYLQTQQDIVDVLALHDLSGKS